MPISKAAKALKLAAKKVATRKKDVAPPSPPSTEFPYVHVGHGVSAARKDWGFVIVLRDPADAAARAAIAKLSRPEAMDTLEVERDARAIFVGHTSDSLQWVVAATYGGAGTRADKGEATSEQWQAFNRELDDFLAALHAKHPIAVVIRTIDEEYSTDVSPWHAWSCRALAPYLPFLAAALSSKSERWHLEHALDLWRGWLAEQPLDEQTAIIDDLDDAACDVLERNGGVPEPEAPARPSDPMPSLDEMKAAWAAIPPDADALRAFESAFSHLYFEDGKVELLNFLQSLAEEPTNPAHDAILVDVARRAIATPGCEFADTHWRPDLVDALLRLGRIDEARRDLAWVVGGACSYISSNWITMIKFLDATGRAKDGDVVYRAADRYTTGFELDRKLADKKAPKDHKQRVAAILVELAAPLLDDTGALDDEYLSDIAFLFGDLVEEGVAGDTLQDVSKRLRDEYNARRDRRLADGFAALARGDALDREALSTLIDEAKNSFSIPKLVAAEIERLAVAALAHPSLIPQLESLAYYTSHDKPDVAIAIYRAILATPPPSVALEDGAPRQSWLQCANAALVVTHAQKRYDDSARLADALVQYVRENPYITHAAACSYAAVERYDDALEQARLAVELGYDNLDKLQEDTDLGPLLARKDFKALFQKRKK
jgi:hypothetical protein